MNTEELVKNLKDKKIIIKNKFINEEVIIKSIRKTYFYVDLTKREYSFDFETVFSLDLFTHFINNLDNYRRDLSTIKIGSCIFEDVIMTDFRCENLIDNITNIFPSIRFRFDKYMI